MSHGAGEAQDSVSAKASLILAATELFATKGFTKTAVREIAEAAGVAKPTLYYYFGSKHGLGLAILKEASTILQEAIVGEMEGAAGAVEKLIAYVKAHFRACGENEALARFMYSLSFSPAEAPPGYDVIKVHEAARELLNGLVAEAVQNGVILEKCSEAAEMALMGILNIYIMDFLVLGIDIDQDQAERSVRMLLSGVGNHQDD